MDGYTCSEETVRLRDENARLRAEVAEAEKERDRYNAAYCQACDVETALRAEVEALRADAERYRWLRRRVDCIGTDDNRECDAEVDAALAAAGRGE